jgi:hypothetical protein
LRKQPGTKVELINRETRTIWSSFSTLSYEIRARGDYLGLSHFNPRQFSYGVRAKPWGRSQRFGGAFVLGSASNNVFVNTRTFSPKSGRYNAIKKLFGPSIPKELVKDEAKRAFEEGSPDVLSEATRQLQRLIEGS